jgi:predicted AAA+ superfamily ATPase
MIIKRDSYLDKLKIRMNNGMIKVIIGIRRSGKSFLLFELFKNYLSNSGVDDEHIIEIALDGIDSAEMRDPNTCYRYIKSTIKDDKMYYVFLDEVQFMPHFEEVLNSLLHIKNIDVYVTGSNSKFLSSDIVTEFRGRGDELRVYPLTFAEFFSVYKGEYNDAWEEYMAYGGLPQAVLLPTEVQKIDYLKNIFSNVYLKDVIERNRIQNIDEIGTLVDVLASAIGSLTNPSRISNTFKSTLAVTYSNKTISQHIDYLEDAFLISKARRFDIKGRKNIGANLKYYFTDVGLRNARLNFREQEATHIIENIVYNELLARNYNVDVGIVDVFSKNAEGKSIRKNLEVDFVVNQGSNRYYIQVAYDINSEEKQKQEFNSFRNIADSFKKILIVNGTSKPWRNNEGFLIMGMKHFLLNENSLDF